MASTRQGEHPGKLQEAASLDRDGSRRGARGKRPHPVEPVRVLQQTLGNQGVLRRMEAGLRINDVNDPAEKEADRVAAAVTAIPGSEPHRPAVATSAAAAVQRKCASCAQEDDLTLQRKESSPTQIQSAPPIVGQVLNSPGQPLDSSARRFMEARFGNEFEAVRIHTDTQAAESARSISATAYTVGDDVVFSHGSYSPNTGLGRRILAHELAHVIQQRRGGVVAGLDSGRQVEQAADEASLGAMRGEGPVRVAGASAAGIARLPSATNLFILPFSQDQDVSKLTPVVRQQLIQAIDKRLLDLDKQSSQPKPDIVIPVLQGESQEAERARLFDWRKKLEAGTGILAVPGIQRSSPPPTQASQGSAATVGPPPTPAKVAPRFGTHETPVKRGPLDFPDSMEAVAKNYYGSGQSTSGSTSRTHASPGGYLAPTGVPHTLEDTIAAANADPHRKRSGEVPKQLETAPLSQGALEAAKKQFYRKPGEVTLPDGQEVIIPPRPSGEITGDITFGDSVLARANVQGVRADVVRKLNVELKSIEKGPLNREVLDDLRKAREAISEGDLESAVELTKSARSAQRVIPTGIAAMSLGDRLAEAVKRAIPKLPGETGARIQELLRPEAIATMAGFTAVYVISQATPAGWVADIVAAGLLLATVGMVGSEVIAIVQDIADFASIASNAKTGSDLDNAASHLALAITKLGVDVVVAILLHKAGKAARPYLKPPPSADAVASVVTAEGKPLRVPLDSVPESGSATKGRGGGPDPQAGTESRGAVDPRSTPETTGPKNLSRNELLEEAVRRRYHPNASTLSAKSAGFDFAEGQQTVSAHTTVRGGQILVDERIAGGKWIQLKIVSATTERAAIDNTKVAMERAENALKGVPKNKPELVAQGSGRRFYEKGEENLKWTRENLFERVSEKHSYRTSYAGKPDEMEIDLHFENVDPADKGTLARLQAAAQKEIDTSAYKEDLPPVRLRVTAGPVENPTVRIETRELADTRVRVEADAPNETIEQDIDETTESGKRRRRRFSGPR